MNLQEFVRNKNRSLTSFATLVLGLSLAVTARRSRKPSINYLRSLVPVASVATRVRKARGPISSFKPRTETFTARLK